MNAHPNSLSKLPIQIPYSNSLFKVPIHSPRSNPQIKIPIQNFKSFIQNPHSKSPFKIPIQNPYSKHFRGRAPTPTFLDMLFSKIAFISNAVLIFFSNFIEIFEKICKISKKNAFSQLPRAVNMVYQLPAISNLPYTLFLILNENLTPTYQYSAGILRANFHTNYLNGALLH